jgi:hypothetical protein
MRDRAVILDHGVERGALHRQPLFTEFARLAERMEGEVWSRAVWIDMDEAAGDIAGYGRSPRRSRSPSHV